MISIHPLRDLRGVSAAHGGARAYYEIATPRRNNKSGQRVHARRVVRRVGRVRPSHDRGARR
jgi:hypothetical protein